MRDVSQHLEACADCHAEYRVPAANATVVVGHRGGEGAADLALKLRVAISREAARTREPYWPGLRVRLENSLNAFMFPAMAGLAAAVVIFGILLGFLAFPLQASNADVPLSLNTDPQLQQSGFGSP